MAIQRGKFIDDARYFASKLGTVTAEKGVGHVVRFATRWAASPLLEPVYRHRRKGWQFQVAGRSYPYFWHRYNTTWRNERAVEVPIAWDAVQRYRGKRILEVGNVLSHYFEFDHDTLDKYETVPGVINEDVVGYEPSAPYDLIVSISTIEHVGWDERPRQPNKIPEALARMKSWLAPGGQILVTVPLGYNDDLDNHLRNGTVKFPEQRYLIRTSQDNRWSEATWDDVAHAKYGVPYPGSGHMLLGIIRAEDPS